MSFVISQTKKIMREALTHFGKKASLEPKQVQLLISSVDESGNPTYTLMHDYQPIQLVTFLEILNKSFDFMQTEAQAAPFLKNALNRLAKQLETEVTNISILIFTDGAEVGNEVRLYLCNGHENIKELDFEQDIFI